MAGRSELAMAASLEWTMVDQLETSKDLVKANRLALAWDYEMVLRTAIATDA
jgi:hypothetical protein